MRHPARRQWLLMLATLLLAAPASAQVPGAIAAPARPELPTSGLVVTGPARNGAQAQALGPRGSWLGHETGNFEAWIYPLKVVRDLELTFEFRGRTYGGSDLAREVEVRPEWTAITYSHEAFRVRQVFAAPRDVPGLVMLLAVDASFPLDIDIEFHIDLQPMWPASVGGQFSWWDASLPGFVIGEGSGRNAALIGSPAATEPTIQPAHSLPEHPTRFRLHIEPDATRDRWIPVVVVARAADVDTPSDDDAMREIYQRLASDPIAEIAATAEHFGRLESTRGFVTPDERLNSMLAWANVRLDQGMVCNPHLGCGMIAGYGAAGAGYRPGFGWFFGGDTFYNSWALTAAGHHVAARQALEFLAAQQRDDGKIMHELSQGAGYVDWFGDYPYGFYHAETTPYFVGAVAEHVRATGDRPWAAKMLPALRSAIAYCIAADTDGDGLMENTAAGLAAVEMGALREARVHQDVYLASVWVRALEQLEWLVGYLDDDVLSSQSDRLRTARASLLGTWMEDLDQFAFATRTDGSAVADLTLWNILPVALLQEGEDLNAVDAVATIASPAITTDWGTRMLATTSPLYDPLVYNQGTVWPFLSGFAAMAAYRADQQWYGEDLLFGLTRLGEDFMLGAWPEVLSGDRYQTMGPAVPNQLFSAASLITPFVRGLMGIDLDVANSHVELTPHLPYGWPRAVASVPYGEGELYIRYTQTDSSLEMTAELLTPGEIVEDTRSLVTSTMDFTPPEVVFSPRLPLGATDLRIDGRPAERATALLDLRPDSEGTLRARSTFTWQGGVNFAIRRETLRPGSPSSGLRILRASWNPEAEQLELDIAGRVGETYTLETDAEWRYLGGIEVPGAAVANHFVTHVGRGVSFKLHGSAGEIVAARIALLPATEN